MCMLSKIITIKLCNKVNVPFFFFLNKSFIMIMFQEHGVRSLASAYTTEIQTHQQKVVLRATDKNNVTLSFKNFLFFSMVLHHVLAHCVL